MKNLLLLLFLFAAGALPAADDLLIADFDGTNYGAWKTTGDAFGPVPARGALAGQMAVSGFLGEGLANSFLKGDNATGTLTSPAFKVERKFITFLIGGGGYASETCMNLLVAGQVVRTATGPNVESGGSESLSPRAWDVTEFAGREATIQIVDNRQGGWGHINVDHLAQTDSRGNIPLAGPPVRPQELTRRVKMENDFLQLPVIGRNNGSHTGLEKFSIEADGKVLRYLTIDLAKPGQTPEQTYSYDVRELRGREVTLRYRSTDSNEIGRAHV